MTPATSPRSPNEGARLLVVGADGSLDDTRIETLANHLRAGDLVVVNDAATLPASLEARTGDATIEVRLAARGGDGTWQVVLFGGGDWRTPTEDRPPPPPVAVGCTLHFGAELRAVVLATSDLSPRLVTVRFEREGAALLSAIYALGHPVQYAHLNSALPLWSIQTAYAARPWAVELPSAGRPLSFSILRALARRHIEVATVTHAAGLSATGDPHIDRALPLPEPFEVPTSTLFAIAETRRAGGSVYAIGTSVVRALEASASIAGASLPIIRRGTATLRIGPEHELRVVDGLLTGMHVPGESHHDLMQAFAPTELLDRVAAHATARGYLCHEFGDVTLIQPRRPSRHARSDSAAPAHRSRPRASAP